MRLLQLSALSTLRNKLRVPNLESIEASAPSLQGDSHRTCTLIGFELGQDALRRFHHRVRSGMLSWSAPILLELPAE